MGAMVYLSFRFRLPTTVLVCIVCICSIARGQNVSCLSIRSNPNQRFLKYPDGSNNPVLIPYPQWTSAQIFAEIAHIILSEVMDYAGVLVPIDTVLTGPIVSYVAGCLNETDCTCRKRNLSHPKIHFTLETWTGGASRAECLPADIKPTLLSILGYSGDDTVCLWQNVVDSGWTSHLHLSLDDYQSYDAALFKAHVFFDPWPKMLEIVPKNLILRCAQYMAGGSYTRYTHDTNLSCYYNDSVWFSPACRQNTSECVPLMLRYGNDDAMQLAYFLNMPLAIVMVAEGNNYDEYYAAIRKGNFLFSYSQPDDSLFDGMGRAPVILNMPRQNELEQLAHLYRTGEASEHLRNYAWRELATVDPHVFYFASNANLFTADMQALLSQTRRLKDEGMNVHSAAREAACRWVKGNRDRWTSWIPKSCPNGSAVAFTLTDCAVCRAGTFCPGGWNLATVCPPAFYCPSNASEPIPCSAGWTTARPGATSMADCSQCLAGFFLVANTHACVAFSLVLPAVIAPALLILVTFTVALFCYHMSKEEALWRIKESDVVCCSPLEILGRGSGSVTIKVLHRGTPMAVKHFMNVPRSFSIESCPSLPEIADGTFTAVVVHSQNLSAVESQQAPVVRVKSGRSERALLADLKALTSLRHPCIISVLGVTTLSLGGRRGVCLVMELMEIGSLYDLLHNKMFHFDCELALRSMQNVAQAVRFLHEATPPLVHDRLNSWNVLFDRNFTPKISTPRIRWYSQEDEIDETLLWTAPECLSTRRGITVKSDVYSFGVILWECLTRKVPFEGENVEEVRNAIVRRQRSLAVPPDCSVEVTALLKDCLNFNPDRRPHFEEIERRIFAFDYTLMTSSACAVPSYDSKGLRWSQTYERGQRKRSSENILRHRFPHHVAEALLHGQKVPPESKEMVTMCFVGIVDFALMSSTMRSEKVGNLLDRLHYSMDQLADQFGVYVIETICDIYMCATNISAETADHAAVMARFCEAAMMAAGRVLVDEEDLSMGFVQILMGLNSGPCIASVVGKTNQKYTLLGDTINVASRMESTSLPGRIQCTARTAELIRSQDPSIQLQPRGSVEVKGRGSMKTYWICCKDTVEHVHEPAYCIPSYHKDAA